MSGLEFEKYAPDTPLQGEDLFEFRGGLALVSDQSVHDVGEKALQNVIDLGSSQPKEVFNEDAPSPLSRAQRLWLGGFMDQEDIERINLLDKHDRMMFGVRLGNLLLTQKQLKNKLPRAHLILEAMSGLTNVEMGARYDITGRAMKSRIKSLRDSLASIVDSNHFSDLIVLSDTQEQELALDDYKKMLKPTVNNRKSTFVPQEGIDTTIKRYRRHKLLSAEEEIALAKRIEKGDLTAKNELINRNLKFVISIAKQYPEDHLKLDDLIHEGVLGLMRATEKFDWRKGYRFTTYAGLWIRQSIQRGLQNTGHTIRTPTHHHQTLFSLRKIETNYQKANGGESISIEQLSRISGVDVHEIMYLRAISAQITSLDRELTDDDDTTFYEIVPSNQLSVEDEVISRNIDCHEVTSLSPELLAYVDRLSETQAEVIKMRFGVYGPEYNSEEIGQKLSIHPNSIKPIISRGTAKIAAMMQADGYEPAA